MCVCLYSSSHTGAEMLHHRCSVAQSKVVVNVISRVSVFFTFYYVVALVVMLVCVRPKVVTKNVHIEFYIFIE